MSRTPLTSQRRRNVRRGNAASLPDYIQAHLILEIQKSTAREASKCGLNWKDIYEGFSRDKVRKRHKYLCAQRWGGSKKE